MANAELKRVSVNIKVENGTDSEGNVKLTSISLGTLSKDNFNADKALAIVNLLEPVLDNVIASVEKTEVSTLTAA